MLADAQPVIIGVAQETWRDRNAQRTPIDALQAVTTKALSDTGSAALTSQVDALVHVPFIMNQVPELAEAMPRNPGAMVAERLGIRCRQYTADVGGNLPQQLIGDFAQRLVRGEHACVLLCGAELLDTFLSSLRGGAGFPEWASGREDDAENLISTPPMTAESERAHGLFEPVNAYPLFESAVRHARGLDAAAHRQLLGDLISRMSEVAADNPYAWKQQRFSAADVLDTEGGNRMISHPYTKLMNAIIAVDQAAAVILTTAGRARAMGIDPQRWVYLRGAAAAHDSWYLSERETLHDSPALRLAGGAALAQSGLRLEDLAFFDLYSCFPSAVQIACDALGLALDDPRGVTVTGGLTLFGGPGNNYSMHAIAQMVEFLRAADAGASGLVTANGGYLTKHAVGVYSRRAPESAWSPPDTAELQRAADAHRGPALADVGAGPLRIEAHTVRYGKEGPGDAILLGTLRDGRRCVALCSDTAAIQRLIDDDCVGDTGRVEHVDGLNKFQF